MSRSYNEDWQRRKAYLIRSLFHDIPNRVLSPVLEESTESSPAQPDINSIGTSNSQEPQTSSLPYEESDTPESPGFIEAPACSLVTSTPVTRPYSPLPPLIIERIPNKHDEPIEFYRSLLAKMRRIYRKMILEDKDLEEFEQNFIMDDSELNEESLTFNSNGYNADLESTCSYELNTDINHYSESQNEVNTARDFNENDNEIISVISNDYNKDSDSEVDEAEKESSANDEPSYSQKTFQADVHMDGTPLPAAKPSPIYEERRMEVTPASINKFPIEGFERQSQVFSNSLNSSLETRPIYMCGGSPCAKIKDLGCKGQEFELIRSPANQNCYTDSVHRQINEEASPETGETLVTESQLNEDLVRSPILRSQSQYGRPRGVHIAPEGNQDFMHSEVAVDVKAATHELHCDLLDKEKRDSAFVLRFRKSGERSLLAGRDSTLLENDYDPEIAPFIEDNHIGKELEAMRTPRHDASEDSIPICTDRLSKNMDISYEHSLTVDNMSNSTELSVDDKHIRASHQNVSNDIEGILAAIFNNSQETNTTSSNFTDAECSNSRKRHFEEISVQTDNVNWKDVRNNFFVGTPKVFKLCSCVGHYCI